MGGLTLNFRWAAMVERCVCIYALSDDDISSRVRIGFFLTRAPKQMQLSGSYQGRASTC